MTLPNLTSILKDAPSALEPLLTREGVYSAFVLNLVESNHRNVVNDEDSLYLRVAHKTLTTSSQVDEQTVPSTSKDFISLSIKLDCLGDIYDAINSTLSEYVDTFFKHGLVESYSPHSCASPCFILTEKGKTGLPLTYDKYESQLSKGVA